MNMKSRNLYTAGAALCALLVLAAATPARAQGFKCFPSCNPRDGRFLVIAFGPDLKTLTDSQLDVEIGVAAGTPTIRIGVFDGDDGGVDATGTSHWDLEPDDPGTGQPLGQIPFEYTLYADPLGDGSGMTPVELQPGFAAISSTTMPDNDWIDFTVNNPAAAQSPSGNYFYRLNIRLVNPTPGVNVYNAFKIRTTGVASVELSAQPFSYIASLGTEAEAKIIYPNFQGFAGPFPYDLSNPTYDGKFSFFFGLAQPQTDVAVWDGDFDHGNWDGSNPDTDDPDTPSCNPQVASDPPCLPFETSPEAVPEGVAVGLLDGSNLFPRSTGNPPDDLPPDQLFFLRPPAIFYNLRFPDGQVFLNDNPSGNQEWEQFKVSTAPFDRAQMDYHTSSVPQGTYEVRIEGVDMSNLNALRLPSRVLCVDDANRPCTPLFPFLIGDTVFLDANGNGVQDAGENGVAGVTVELIGTLGTVFATTTTDAAGHYSFPVEAGTYTVRVAASSFNPGGPLAGAIATTNNPQTNTVVNDNVLSFDFGFRGTGSLGDRVWLDANANGVQDSGETGINGATVELLDGAGHLLATAVTSGDGNYTFGRLFAGNYTVRVDPSTLPAGAAETYDLDGTATPNTAAASLAGGQSRTDVDFGYRVAPPPGTATIGYWKTHAAAWPVTAITIGGVVYSRDQAIAILNTPSRGDKSIDLFDQLLAAKLNVIVGNNASCIAATVASADAWAAIHPPGSHVSGSSAAWTMASPWHTQLDNYNNGLLCAPHRN